MALQQSAQCAEYARGVQGAVNEWAYTDYGDPTVDATHYVRYDTDPPQSIHYSIDGEHPGLEDPEYRSHLALTLLHMHVHHVHPDWSEPRVMEAALTCTRP